MQFWIELKFLILSDNISDKTNITKINNSNQNE